MTLINCMERLVSESATSIVSAMGGCDCPHCMADVMAIALNKLPPQYVATEQGEVLAKANNMSQQYSTDVVKAVGEAVEIVKEFPRH